MSQPHQRLAPDQRLAPANAHQRLAPANAYQRLSVNINEESAEILREVTRERGITATEAIRRAIGLLGFFEAARKNDTTVWTEDKKGDKAQLHIV